MSKTKSEQEHLKTINDLTEQLRVQKELKTMLVKEYDQRLSSIMFERDELRKLLSSTTPQQQQQQQQTQQGLQQPAGARTLETPRGTATLVVPRGNEQTSGHAPRRSLDLSRPVFIPPLSKASSGSLVPQSQPAPPAAAAESAVIIALRTRVAELEAAGRGQGMEKHVQMVKDELADANKLLEELRRQNTDLAAKLAKEKASAEIGGATAAKKIEELTAELSRARSRHRAETALRK